VVSVVGRRCIDVGVRLPDRTDRQAERNVGQPWESLPVNATFALGLAHTREAPKFSLRAHAI
jgi:hypothetical protein